MTFDEDNMSRALSTVARKAAKEKDPEKLRRLLFDLFCTPESNYIRGQVVVCSGGFMM